MTAPPPRLVLVPRELLDIVLSNADIEIRMSMRPTEHSVALGQIKNLRAMLSAPEAPSEEMERVVERFSKPVFAAIDEKGAVILMPVAPEDWHQHPLAHKARWIGGHEDADVARAALAALLAGEGT